MRSMSLNVKQVSHSPSLTHFFSIFPSFLYLSDCVPSFSLFFKHQGSEKGWSDCCRTTKEDSEQLESPRFLYQEWSSTCLNKQKQKKEKIKEMRTSRDHSAGLCWHNTVTTYFNYMEMQMDADKDNIHVRWVFLFWWTARLRQRNGKEFSTDLPVTKLADNLLPPYPSQDALQTKRGVKNTMRIHKKVKKTWSGTQTWSLLGYRARTNTKLERSMIVA